MAYAKASVHGLLIIAITTRAITDMVPASSDIVNSAQRRAWRSRVIDHEVLRK